MNPAEANPNMEQKCPRNAESAAALRRPGGALPRLYLFKQGAAADTAIPPEAAPFQPPGVEEIGPVVSAARNHRAGNPAKAAWVRSIRPANRLSTASLHWKILPPQTASGPGFIERFNREARRTWPN